MTTILIVDDSLVSRELARGCLADSNLITVFATNGREALESIERDMPDLVLTDLQMPEMDGLELVQEIKASFPMLPVILMTAHGSEEIAVTALKTGAASYVPKKNLVRDLEQTIRVVLSIATARQEEGRDLENLDQTSFTFVIGNELSSLRPLIGHIQKNLRQMSLCNESDLIRVGSALQEALVNAIEHGNLEVDSKLREAENERFYELLEERRQQSPYKDRRVHVNVNLTRSEATCVVRDEGRGFNPDVLRDPTDPANLERVSGRGLLLIRTFMDEVTFNETGNEIAMVKHAPS